MADYIPIDQVPKDFDPDKVVYLTNPLDYDWNDTFDGKPVKIKAGETIAMTEPKAHLIAKHIAEKAMLVPANAAELEARGKSFSERSWELVNELSRGVDPETVIANAKQLVKDKPPREKMKATA